MPNRENVIKGLKVILEETADMLYISTIQDALALLEAHEPRVMTLEEIRNIHSETDVWIERMFMLARNIHLSITKKMPLKPNVNQ